MRELTKDEMEFVSGAGKNGPGREGSSFNGEVDSNGTNSDNNNTNRSGKEGN